MLGNIQGMEGCSTLKYCVRSSWRASARAEYQVNTRGAARQWAAVELGLESWSGADMFDHARSESGVTPIVSAQGGHQVMENPPRSVREA